MGTLKNQKPRRGFDVEDEDVKRFIDEVKDVVKQTKQPFETVLRVYELLELRRKNNLYWHNGDVHDEQMAGIGDELTSLTQAITELKPDGSYE